VCNCVLCCCHRVSTQLQLTNIYHIISYHIKKAHNEGRHCFAVDQAVQVRLCHSQMSLTLVWCWAVLFVSFRRHFYERVILCCYGRIARSTEQAAWSLLWIPFPPLQTSPQTKQPCPWHRAVPQPFYSCLVSPVDADISDPFDLSSRPQASRLLTAVSLSPLHLEHVCATQAVSCMSQCAPCRRSPTVLCLKIHAFSERCHSCFFLTRFRTNALLSSGIVLVGRDTSLE
jgi:hypothetical protein